MEPFLLEVSGYRATDLDDTDLNGDDGWSFALDQRAFGPRKLLVAFGDPFGKLLSLAHCDRTDPPELGLEACIDFLGKGAATAIAYCDEAVTMGPPPEDTLDRFSLARVICLQRGIHLVDWFACDDDTIRSFRLACYPDEEWWSAP